LSSGRFAASLRLTGCAGHRRFAPDASIPPSRLIKPASERLATRLLTGRLAIWGEVRAGSSACKRCTCHGRR